MIVSSIYIYIYILYIYNIYINILYIYSVLKEGYLILREEITVFHFFKKIYSSKDFPSGRMDRNLPVRSRDMGWLPGRIPHAAQLLSQISRAWKPQLVNPHATTTKAHVP